MVFMCIKLVSDYNATNQLAEIQALNMKWTPEETEFFLIVLKVNLVCFSVLLSTRCDSQFCVGIIILFWTKCALDISLSPV